MIKFLYIINKQGVLRLSRYFQHICLRERNQLQASIIKSVMERSEKQCNFFELKDLTIVYRKYVSLYMISAVTPDENELAVLELMQNILETLDQYFQKVTEVDIVSNTERVHMVLDEMIVSGYVGETSKVRALVPLQLLDASKK
ncbi:AP-4 complex subunit sigma-1-like [Haliotis cracherodii]|uniref:AP-4 complex subunit sigma-1-like n=1 Tax=Haliotis rufescens TaxID=6454 RepID=UPI001EB057E9|nr:AP-4 complex subunit sigma-1-like [Haliotis rufescens]